MVKLTPGNRYLVSCESCFPTWAIGLLCPRLISQLHTSLGKLFCNGLSAIHYSRKHHDPDINQRYVTIIVEYGRKISKGNPPRLILCLPRGLDTHIRRHDQC